MGPNSLKANGGEGVIWVRRTLTFIEHLLCAKPFIYVFSFNLQGTIICALRKKKKIEAKTD